MKSECKDSSQDLVSVDRLTRAMLICHVAHFSLLFQVMLAKDVVNKSSFLIDTLGKNIRIILI